MVPHALHVEATLMILNENKNILMHIPPQIMDKFHWHDISKYQPGSGDVVMYRADTKMCKLGAPETMWLNNPEYAYTKFAKIALIDEYITTMKVI